MRATLNLLRLEPRARLFFAAYGQSALGNGAGYIALVVLAYDRWRSAWAIALVLLADFVPAMIFGPVFGAAADRWSRRRVAIASDLVRAVAFVAVAFADDVGATIALALMAGAGAGMFTPAALAALPSLVDQERLAPATALYGALTDVGRTVGPAIAAVGLALTSPEALAVANGATFLVSAGVLALLRFGARPAAPEGDRERPGLLREAREGVRATVRMPGIRVLIAASSGLILFAAVMNVAELLVAEDLGSGRSGFSILVAAAGLGFVLGSLAGAGEAPVAELKRRYLGGILISALGLVLIGLAPVFGLALLGFGLTGIGNGLMLVHERLIFQRVVPDALMARAFALADTVGSWAFAVAFVGGGALIAALGMRPALLVAGAGSALIWVAASWKLRTAWPSGGPPAEPGSRAAGGAEAQQA
jgi:MFS family permease